MATSPPRNTAPFTAGEVSFLTDGALVRGRPDQRSVGVSTDSRSIQPGEAFVALVGDHHDGHAHVTKAAAAGAAMLIVAGDRVAEVVAALDLAAHALVPAVVAVEDTLRALGALASAHRGRWRREGGWVVGITGSAGKTTTKELTAAALAAGLGDDAVAATHGNLNNRIGVPLTLLALEARHRVAVVELGTNQRGEIATLAQIAQPDVSMLVSVGLAHAEGLAHAPRTAVEPWWVGRVPPAEAVAREKSAILRAARRHAMACGDDAWARAALVVAPVPTRTWGRDPTCDDRLLASDWDDDEGRALPHQLIRATVDGELLTFRLGLLGPLAASNAVGAVGAARVVLEGLGQESAPGEALSASFTRRVPTVAGRLAPRLRDDGLLILDDSYNASPDAFHAAIDVAAELASRGRQLVVAVGEMRELGASTEGAHRQLARHLAAARPALVVTCGGAADFVASEVEAEGFEVVRCSDAAHAGRVLRPRVGADHVVLVKGSRGAATERIVETLLAQGPDHAQGSHGEG